MVGERTTGNSSNDVSRLRLHQGKALLSLARNTYNTLTATLVETVQNAIDANARHVVIAIDLRRRHNYIMVLDDGDGATKELFERALASVHSGIKTKDKLGRFGLGLISPLDKCESFTFTTQPRRQPYALEWTFRAADIAEQHEEPVIPLRTLSSLPSINPFEQEGGRPIRWRTIVRMHNITGDRTKRIVSLGELEESINTKLGPSMLKNGVVCHVSKYDDNGKYEAREILPSQFTGQPFPVFECEADQAGKVIVELYRAPKTPEGRRIGKVVFAEIDGQYPLPYSEFSTQARRRNWYSASKFFEALGSGFFEGIVRAEGVSLHENRKSFVYNDALVDLYGALERWFEEVGRSWFDGEQQKEQERRYQQLALSTLDNIRSLFSKPEFEGYRKVIQNSIPVGRIGEGHARRAGETDTQKSVRADRRSQDRKSPEPGTDKNSRDEPESDIPDDLPLTATGPSGQKRKVTRSDSIGLQIAHDWLESSEKLWEFERETGTIWFNIRHFLWDRCDDNDQHIVKLQEWVILQVLSLLMQPEEFFDSLRSVADVQANAFAEMFIFGPMRRKV